MRYEDDNATNNCNNPILAVMSCCCNDIVCKLEFPASYIVGCDKIFINSHEN